MSFRPYTKAERRAYRQLMKREREGAKGDAKEGKPQKTAPHLYRTNRRA